MSVLKTATETAFESVEFASYLDFIGAIREQKGLRFKAATHAARAAAFCPLVYTRPAVMDDVYAAVQWAFCSADLNYERKTYLALIRKYFPDNPFAGASD